MSPLSFLLIAIGAALLWAGGEALVRGAVQLARVLGLSPMVIGLTVVAFATSAPELAATLTASLEGAPQIAIGNVLGSNVANIGLILGLSALLRPLTAQALFLRREVPMMLSAGFVLVPIFAGGSVERWEGTVLLLGLGVYLVILLRPTPEPPAVQEEMSESLDQPPLPLWQAGALVLLGLVLLVGGAKALVEGAVAVALALGIAERVVGLTLVAVGTSLPELASSLVAARKGEGDIVLGNVVGSNVFNVLAILGTTSLVVPIPVAAAARLDLWVAIAFSAAVVPALVPRMRIGRVAGAALLVAYGIYVASLF